MRSDASVPVGMGRLSRPRWWRGLGSMVAWGRFRSAGWGGFTYGGTGGRR